MDFNLESLVRENIKLMKPYSSARHEFSGRASIFLDANENSFGSAINFPSPMGERLGSRTPTGALEVRLNRYPDPLQKELKEKIGGIKGVPSKNIFLGNGSDEVIDLLIRIFCEPGRDNILIFPPTYGMYGICASVNNVTVKKVLLTEDFQLNLEAIEKAIDPFTKLIFICSPNNPTGNSMNRHAVETLLNNFEGLVIIDEAYINFAKQKTFIPELTEYPNLVILQTLSKAWGLAGLRLGMAFASENIIGYLNKVKYPYNINTATQLLALQALDNLDQINEWIRITIQQKEWLMEQLLTLFYTREIFHSDANFLLVKMKEARKIYEYLVLKEIVVRDRSKIIHCDDCLRITIGTPEENRILIKILQSYE